MRVIAAFQGGALARATLLSGMLVALSAPAGAAEVCIKCVAPEQSYRCSITGSSAQDADPRRLALYCAARIAEQYGHQACAIVRAEGQCAGLAVSYAYDPGAAGLPPAIEAHEPAQENDTANKAAAKREGGPPKTMVDLTKQTAEETGKALRKAGEATKKTTKAIGHGVGQVLKDAGKAVGKAGEAVGKATKKTLKCIGSGLEDC